MIDKLRKLLALANDPRANKEEKERAFEKYKELKEKYNIEISEEERKIFDIKCRDEYEVITLYKILESYDIYGTYTFKKCSKLKKGFYSTISTFKLIVEEFEYHKRILNAILLGVTEKYGFEQIKEPEYEYITEEEFENLSELDKIKMKARSGNNWLERADFKKKTRISYGGNNE
ncbi:DUF2786 domain-containing protein [Cetobacterium somerae]|uniref:DUF2786 domain-containing protein n=1 Tax=Cetobacterium somerae TaxID=188913 RepID=UPI00211EF773|nr:DUF2786 domain-containing protein [Cetobacterium somerae]MCQ9626580.1 DUF2786 domain-containing protein [Cetobacterium somerae]